MPQSVIKHKANGVKNKHGASKIINTFETDHQLSHFEGYQDDKPCSWVISRIYAKVRELDFTRQFLQDIHI
jgi:hypothetical protein